MKNKWALFGSFLPLVENKAVSNTVALKLVIFNTQIEGGFQLTRGPTG